MRGNGSNNSDEHHVHHHQGSFPAGTVREERQPPLDDATEMGAGLIRIQLPISMPGLGHVNCYALPDSKGITLVDPGLPGPRAWKELKTRLSAADLPVSRVHTVIITHSHPDHFGQAGRLHQDFGARVITHQNFRTFFDPEEEIDEIATDDIGVAAPTKVVTRARQDKTRNSKYTSGLSWQSPSPWGPSEGHQGDLSELTLKKRIKYLFMRLASGRMGAVPKPTDRIGDAHRLVIGERSWVAMFTPGHTNDHLCLFDPEAGVLISGDHVLPTITPHISGIGPLVDPLQHFFRSLEAVGELDGVTQVLPAHGLEFSDLPGRAKAIIEHHHERLNSLREASADFGWGSVPQYSRRLFQPRSWGRTADSETYAHLEHLRVTGQAEVRDTGKELEYRIYS